MTSTRRRSRSPTPRGTLGYLVSAAIMLLALIITVVAIRVTREDLSGINPMAVPTD